MLKRFLLILIMSMVLPAFADTMPFYLNSIPKTAIGMYQTDKEVTLYSHPESNSDVIRKYDFSYNPENMPDNMFAVLVNEKQLGFLYVTDIDEDGWVQVIYDKQTGAKGWVQTADRMQFLPWLNFYNLYGRKYGLRLLKDAPDESKVLHSKCEDSSQTISKLVYIQQIKLTTLRGNWALVSVFDIDKTPKTGFMKWRNSEGIIYAFPDIK